MAQVVLGLSDAVLPGNSVLILFSKVLYKIGHRIELKLKGYFQYKSHLKGWLYIGETEDSQRWICSSSTGRLENENTDQNFISLYFISWRLKYTPLDFA